jgi:hypothetical protein
LLLHWRLLLLLLHVIITARTAGHQPLDLMRWLLTALQWKHVLSLKPFRVHGADALPLSSHANRPSELFRLRGFHTLRVWWGSSLLDVFVAAKRAVDAETKVVHVALLHLLARVLEDTLRLAANPELGEEAAHGHSVLIHLVEETALLPFHAKPSQPVPANGLPEVLLAHVLLEPGLTHPVMEACRQSVPSTSLISSPHARISSTHTWLRTGQSRGRGGLQVALEVKVYI